jgi:hypothetical protein
VTLRLFACNVLRNVYTNIRTNESENYLLEFTGADFRQVAQTLGSHFRISLGAWIFDDVISIPQIGLFWDTVSGFEIFKAGRVGPRA